MHCHTPSLGHEGHAVAEALDQRHLALHPRLLVLLQPPPAALLPDDIVDAGQDTVVGRGEEVMCHVDVEPCQQDIRPDALHPGVGVTGCTHGMLPEVLDLGAPLGPGVLHSVTAEQHLHEQVPEAAVHAQVQLHRIAQGVLAQEESKNYQGRGIEQIGRGLAQEWHHKQLQDHVDWLEQEEQGFENDLHVPLVGGEVAEVVGDGLECSYLVVELGIRVHVVADAVHDLPLAVREACQQEEVPIRALVMVDEVVPHAHQSHHQRGAQDAQDE